LSTLPQPDGDDLADDQGRAAIPAPVQSLLPRISVLAATSLTFRCFPTPLSMGFPT
jgi:hypothetical protein